MGCSGRRGRCSASLAALWLGCLVAASPTQAQVSVYPPTTTPGAWERFAIRVVNPSDTPVVAVRVVVPAAISILGVEPAEGWSLQPESETRPQVISWIGTVPRGELQEFAFLGRVAGDARRTDLVLPVTLIWPDGSELAWTAPLGSPRPAPRVQIVGTARLSGTGSVALAGVAFVVAMVALIVAVTRRRTA